MLTLVINVLKGVVVGAIVAVSAMVLEHGSWREGKLIGMTCVRQVLSPPRDQQLIGRQGQP